MKVVVGASSFAQNSDKAINKLKEKGIEVIKNPYGRKLNREETIEFIKDADGLLAGLETLDENVLTTAGQLRAIARIGIGMDNVDKEAAGKLGIRVSNTPDAPTEAVAEMALTALLTLSRKIVTINQSMHEMKWKKDLGFSLHEKTIFFIGYGRIGRKFESLLRPFEMNVLFCDPVYPELSVSMDDGIKEADVISIHTSGNNEVLGEREFSKMKKNVILLNSARGKAINEDCLYNGLITNHIAGAWLDVFYDEPYSGKLCECTNAILTPHICTYTDRCRESMEIQAVENLLRDLDL